MLAYLYPASLFLISLLVFGLERAFPWRKEQKVLRPGIGWDLVHLVFNGHYLGVLLALIANRFVLPVVDGSLRAAGLHDALYRNEAQAWPVWVQVPVALLAIDLMHFGVHNLLHRVPFLWEVHKVHHSVRDGQMDFIVAFRFSWLEIVTYKTLLYLPMAWLGFGYVALMTHAVFGTLIGHLNHANLKLDYGPLRYLLNNPRMHLWHHALASERGKPVNFGITFSCWDYLFGTAETHDEPPAALGFPGVENFPRTFVGQELWPAQHLVQTTTARAEQRSDRP